MKNLILPVVLVVATASLAAQPASQAPAQGPTFRTGVDVITIDVAAVDAQGKPVEGLLAPEFVVKVDGQQRRVVSVEQVRVDVEAARRTEAADPFESFFATNITPPEGRLIVIAVDELNIRPGSVRQLLNAAAKFVENLGPADQVAFYAYPQPGAFVDFTTDRLRIKRAMELVVGNQVPYKGRFNIGLYEAVQSMLKQDELMLARVVGRECRRAGAARDLCEQEIVSDMTRMVAKVREDRQSSLLGLQLLMTRLKLIDRPKALVVVSEGLILENPSDLDDTIRQAAIAQASVNVLAMDVQRGSDMTSAVMPATQSEDRDLQVDGLRELASASRGSLYNVIGDGTSIFQRLASELSAYYILGVEADPRDRDDKSHRIDIEVRRRGVTLRSRRAFVLSSPRNMSPAERLSEVLVSPFGVPEVPLRVTTFAMPEGESSRVRLLLAADVGQAGATAAEYTVGWALFDREGKVVTSGGNRQTLTPVDGRTDTPLGFTIPLVVDPGVYSLRFGVVDATGRRGSVVREVNAWKIRGEEFAVGDLVVGAMPAAGQALLPHVEPHVTRDLVALLDLHAVLPATLEQTTVAFEIADGQDAPALVTVAGEIQPGTPATSRTLQAAIGNIALPAGRYVLRARITRNGAIAGVLARPFVLDAPAARAAGAPIAPPVIAPLPIAKFDRAAVLAPALLGEIFDGLEKRSPGLKSAMVEARAGRYSAASLEAFEASDQTAAAFFKGLDWFAKGQLDQAAGQLNIAAGPRREFFPAALFLGAAFAAAGRDRDAAAVWQMGIAGTGTGAGTGTDARPPLVYAIFADARFRDGQPQSVIDVLQPAWQRTPADDEISRRLAAAYVLTNRHADALPVLDSLLTRHPADQDALFAAIMAQYEATTRAAVSLSDVERARLTRWGRAYRGPERALVDKYLAALR